MALSTVLIAILLVSVVSGLDPRWKLIWYDDFTGSQINTNYWNVYDKDGWSQEYCAPSQVSVSGGNLVIKTENTPYKGKQYLSGAVDTAKKFNATQGRWEARAKMPFGKGMWPALWMVSDTYCWPYGMEIDILEQLGRESSIVHGTLHYGAGCGTQYDLSNGTQYDTSVDLSKDFHIYAVEWFTNNMTWYVDDIPYHVVKNDASGMLNGLRFDDTPHIWILNTAVGGSWAGPTDSSNTWPQYHYIDYVKTYGWEPCASGCSGNGCCDNTSGTCKCNAGWFGSTCEFNYALYYNAFSANQNKVLDSVNNGSTTDQCYESADHTIIANNALTLKIDQSGCPNACEKKSYVCGSWSHGLSYMYGNFSFKAKGASVSGTSLQLTATGSIPSENYGMHGGRIFLNGASKTKISFDTWVAGQQTSSPAFDLGFDHTAAYHNYTIWYSNKKLSFFVDGALIYNITTGLPRVALSPGVLFDIHDQWYGTLDYTGPTTTAVAAVQYSVEPKPAVCPTTTSTTSTTKSSSSTSSSPSSSTSSSPSSSSTSSPSSSTSSSPSSSSTSPTSSSTSPSSSTSSSPSDPTPSPSTTSEFVGSNANVLSVGLSLLVTVCITLAW